MCRMPHAYTAHAIHSVVFAGYRRHTPFTGNEPKYKKQMRWTEWIHWLRNGQATPSLHGGNVSRRSMSSSHPALLAVSSDQFYGIMEITSPTTMQVKSASREQAQAEDALDGPGRYENIILRMESQGFSIRNTISEEIGTQLTWGHGKRRWLCVILSRSANSQWQSMNTKDRQARDAVNQAVRESSES